MKVAQAAPTRIAPAEAGTAGEVIAPGNAAGRTASTGSLDATALLRRSVFGPNPLGAALVVPMAGVVVAVAALILLGAVSTASGARGVATNPAVVLLALVLTPVFQLALAIRMRRLWPAQEAYLWFRMSMADRWREAHGEGLAGSPAVAREWLARHRPGSASDFARAAMLAAAGRTPEAREVVAALPGSTPGERRWREELAFELDVLEGRPIDPAGADAATRADPALPPAEKELAIAHHVALQAAARGTECLEPLAAARKTAGRPPWRYSRQILMNRYRGVFAAALLGLWILVAITVGMAMSGGVVWL